MDPSRIHARIAMRHEPSVVRAIGTTNPAIATTPTWSGGTMPLGIQEGTPRTQCWRGDLGRSMECI